MLSLEQRVQIASRNSLVDDALQKQVRRMRREYERTQRHTVVVHQLLRTQIHPQ